MNATSSIGLSDHEVLARREKYGANTIESQAKISIAAILLHQFKSPVVYLLGAAALLAMYFQEWSEGAAIFVVLALNALIGFVTELKAARSIKALRALGGFTVRVRRNGRIVVIQAEELVPGDIVLVEGGDGISADMRLLEASNLAADESTLTGESVAVNKSTEPVEPEARAADRKCMLFKGTSVTRGAATAIVVSTGLSTELGRISRLAEQAGTEQSPLEKGLAKLSGQLVLATLFLTVLVAAVGVLQGGDLYLMVTAAIALAVAAIPEGLPVVATLTLARGMWRMAQHNALIERLAAVETLGATTIILTDKTGTLTENRMTVRRLWTPEGETDLADPDRKDEVPPPFLRLAETAVLCNNASLGDQENDDSGDPMEQALLRFGLSQGIEQGDLNRQQPRLREIAFDTATKMMATVHSAEEGVLFCIKGAPEMVLQHASFSAAADGDVPLDEALRSEWQNRIDTLGDMGLRVLACASKTSAAADTDPYEDLTFLGLVGLKDPARADVPGAISACKAAGIRVIMVTGDHAVTARNIAGVVGLGETENIRTANGLDIPELIQADGNKLRAIDVFARVSPAEKLELVSAYQQEGAVVAMTGDGVNDAPALNQADIGVAMGKRGTDVAREAADMILLDDAFPTIVKAVREGRVIFGNIRRFAAYLLSCNLSEVMIVGLAVLLALPLPLLPLQILYLNLVTDVFPAFALAMGEGEDDVMDQSPRPPHEPILGRPQWMTIISHGFVLTMGTFGAMLLAMSWLDLTGDALVTVTFLTLAFGQLWHVFNMRHSHSRVFGNEVTRNLWVWAAIGLCIGLLVVPAYVPQIGGVLHLVRPTGEMWLVILPMSVLPLLINQLGAIAVERFKA